MSTEASLSHLSRSEAAALAGISKAAGWLQSSFCKRTNFFYVAISRGNSFPPDPLSNSASSLIGLSISRDTALTQELSEDTNFRSFLGMLRTMSEAIKNTDTLTLLPARSFGFLPTFSTAYLAELLPAIYAEEEKVETNIAYLVSLRRLIVEVLELGASSIDSLTMHPFLLLHVHRAMRKAHESLHSDKRALDRILAIDELRNGVLSTLKPGRRQREIDGEFNRLVQGGARGADFAEPVPDLLDRCLWILEQSALNATHAEIALEQRAGVQGLDPSALAFALLCLSEGGHAKHASLIAQGLEILVKAGRVGSYSAGRPFYSDEKGRSLLVPSVEIATAMILIAVNPALALSQALLDSVVACTESTQQFLLSDHNSIMIRREKIKGGVKESIKETRVEGWCSDRAQTPERVDSWVTAHGIEFLMARVRLLRYVKHTRLCTLYSSEDHTKISPDWKGFEDPDKGHCARTVKSKIEEAVDGKARGIAPVFLLYGPPGTSKTTAARALAAKQGWDPLLLSPSDFVSESLDKIEYRSRQVFEDLMHADRCVIIFDEIDTLFRNRQWLRTKQPGSILEFVVPALLPKLQNFRDYAMKRQLVIFFLTNFYELIDPAIARGGRIDIHVPVLPYSKQSRENIAQKLYESARPKGVASEFEKLRDVLSEMPCNLVYRDIATIARAATTQPFDRDRLLRESERLGVQPETYDPKERPEAAREVCMFLSRVVGHTYTEELERKNDMIDFLNKCSQRAHAQKFERWEKFANAWINHLSTRPD